MISEKYKNLLNEIFDVIGIPESGRDGALTSIKKKVAYGMYQSLKDKLPPDSQKWINEHVNDMTISPDSVEVQEIQKHINATPDEELLNLSLPIFKKVVTDYVDFMSEKLDPGKAPKLREILANL